MIWMWCLSEAGEDNLGLACTNNGLVLGRTPLIERRGHRFVVRERDEIEALLSRAYRKNITADRLMPGLATVAAALNANDAWLGADRRGAFAHSRSARSIRARRAGGRGHPHQICIDADPRDIHKASLGTIPSIPAGRPERRAGLGGKNPTQGRFGTPQSRRRRRVYRYTIGDEAALRTAVSRALHAWAAEAVANLDPRSLTPRPTRRWRLDVARHRSPNIGSSRPTRPPLSILRRRRAPRTLRILQVHRSEYEEFAELRCRSSRSGLGHQTMMAKRFGGAGAGNQYHHIVTQGGANPDQHPTRITCRTPTA